MVHFRVQKGSTFAFECCSDPAAHAQSEEIERLFIRAEDLEALQIEYVNIVKRLDLKDVDRMIALCRQHPPQCVLSPASVEHTVAFQEFTAYLKQRQRAGVATLANGFLLLLTPIPKWDNYLRCLVIKSKTNELDAESVSSHSSVRSEGEEANGSRNLQPERIKPDPSSPKRRKRAREQGQGQPEASTATEVRLEFAFGLCAWAISWTHVDLLIDIRSRTLLKRPQWLERCFRRARETRASLN